MKTVDFYNKLKTIINNDQRYHEDAYEFINDAVVYTVEKNKVKNEKRHISGKELLDGVIEYAVKTYGPLAYNVLLYWGIDSGTAVGNIVFNMVKCKILSTSENDSIDDFKNYEDFKAALTKPFTPRRREIPDILPVIS
ncbi:MAG: hypothetical protein K9L78_03970 [Victivallales bacterium]|nr:hypothetical protein [Victivallales bacterium]MCF7889258.1 hypothetical protein [Victivallales bacterium]